MRVIELMTHRPITTIEPSASCHDAIEHMIKGRLRHLPVVESDGRLVGIVTDRDIRHHFFKPAVFGQLGRVTTETLLQATPVGTIMSAPPVTADLDMDITDAARVMRERKVGSLPVMDGTRVAGMLTETDLLRQIVRADQCCCPEVETIVISYP